MARSLSCFLLLFIGLTRARRIYADGKRCATERTAACPQSSTQSSFFPAFVHSRRCTRQNGFLTSSPLCSLFSIHLSSKRILLTDKKLLFLKEWLFLFLSVDSSCISKWTRKTLNVRKQGYKRCYWPQFGGWNWYNFRGN